MSTVTKPIILDESVHTTEVTPRNVADVLAEELSNIASKIQGGGGGSTVSWNQLQVTGDKIAEITISGHKTNVYSHSIAVSRFQLTGTHIADIIIDGVRNPLYAEQGGGSFSALIIITDDTGKTITATKGGDSYTATETSTGHYEVTVDSLGTWTISDGTNTGTVVVSAQTTYYFSFRPNGSTVTPTDDITIWLQCGGRSENYTTLAQVLADSSCLSALMADNNAVDYLVRSTTFASDVTADQTAMSYIGLNNYCANTLLADSTWCNAILSSTYFESVLNVKVPTMTSNTAPSGECIGESVYNATYTYYKAFDGSTTDSGWESQTVSSTSSSYPTWLGYDFGRNVTLYLAEMTIFSNDNKKAQANINIQSSDDKSTWTAISDTRQTSIATSGTDSFSFTLTPTTARYFAVHFNLRPVKVQGQSLYYAEVQELQFYGREDV